MLHTLCTCDFFGICMHVSEVLTMVAAVEKQAHAGKNLDSYTIEFQGKAVE